MRVSDIASQYLVKQYKQIITRYKLTLSQNHLYKTTTNTIIGGCKWYVTVSHIKKLIKVRSEQSC